MTRNYLAELQIRLKRGFSADNLDSAATLAFESSWNDPNPLGLFVVTRVLRILEDHWDVPNLRDQAWMTQRAIAFMEDHLRPPLLQYLDQVSTGELDAARELRLLNDIVQALFKWTAERPDPRPK